MTAPSNHGVVVPVAGGLVLLLALYVGAYYWMAAPVGFFPVDVVYSWDGETVHPFVNRPASILFAPIHWLDRRIRPHVWGSPFEAWEP